MQGDCRIRDQFSEGRHLLQLVFQAGWLERNNWKSFSPTGKTSRTQSVISLSINAFIPVASVEGLKWVRGLLGLGVVMGLERRALH